MMPLTKQPLTHMRTNEARPTRYKNTHFELPCGA